MARLPLAGAWLHATNHAPKRQKKTKTAAIEDSFRRAPDETGGASTSGAATSSSVAPVMRQSMAVTPTMRLDRAAIAKGDYRQALRKYIASDTITIVLQSHTEGALIDRMYRLEVFRDYWRNQKPPIEAPHEVERVRLFCLWVAGTDESSDLARSYFTAMAYSLLVPPLNPDTNRQCAWMADAPRAVRSLAIASDDIKRATNSFEKEKAPLIAREAWAKLQPLEKATVRLWVNLGTRWNSVEAIMPQDAQCPIHPRGKISVHITREKITAVANRTAFVSCCCDKTTKSGLGVVCDPQTKKISFPLREAEVRKTLQKIGARFRSPWRTSAIYARTRVEAGDRFDFSKYMLQRGWTVVATFFGYCVDYAKTEADRMLPAAGALELGDMSSKRIAFPEDKSEAHALHEMNRSSGDLEGMEAVESLLLSKGKAKVPKSLEYYQSRSVFLAEGRALQNGQELTTRQARPKVKTLEQQRKEGLFKPARATVGLFKQTQSAPLRSLKKSWRRRPR
ncbi:unnamed protein product [Amoebophrya sp. A25]|nr:unnamed protein product [Amoebophrya sp. A25]|eukprot:GSA25T00023394001.1